MVAGIPDADPTTIILSAGWPRPSCPVNLYQQSLLLLSFEHAINHPPGEFGDKVSAAPARSILSTLCQNMSDIRASHDNLIQTLVSSLGFGSYYVVAPLQQIVFKTTCENTIKVIERTFAILENGSISTKKIISKELGCVPFETFQRLAAIPSPAEPNRVCVPLTALCTDP